MIAVLSSSVNSHNQSDRYVSDHGDPVVRDKEALGENEGANEGRRETVGKIERKREYLAME